MRTGPTVEFNARSTRGSLKASKDLQKLFQLPVDSHTGFIYSSLTSQKLCLPVLKKARSKPAYQYSSLAPTNDGSRQHPGCTAKNLSSGLLLFTRFSAKRSSLGGVNHSA
jgi:hypothetical protein